MLGVAGGAILVPLNSTMLAVALPGIMDEFALQANEVSSLVTLYLGAVALTLPVAGSLTDRFGARRVFIAGVLGFAAASLGAAIGSSFPVLEGARVLQAVAGALVSTSSATLIRQTAPAARQGEAFGLFDLLVSISAAVGPFVGGILVGALAWRSIFTLAIPIALLAAAIVTILLRDSRCHHAYPTRPADRRAGPVSPGAPDRRRPRRDAEPGNLGCPRPRSASGPFCWRCSSSWSFGPSIRPWTRDSLVVGRSHRRSPASSE